MRSEGRISAGPGSTAEPFLTAHGIAKSFGGARALKGVGFTLRPGEVHGLVGANGAGKSTFIRVLAGLVQPDAGNLAVDGAETGPLTPHAATQLGLSFIHQELAIVPGMTVIENITLGMPKAARFGLPDWRAVRAEVLPVAQRVGLRAPMQAQARRLSVSDQWLVSICRALVRKTRLIVMDEPTAALSETEAERLFAIVRDLSASGVATLYVSHRLDEITELCQRVTVFRDGAVAAELSRNELTRHALVQAIVGGELAPQAEARTVTSAGPVVLKLHRLARAPAVRDASLALRAGEVLGIGGLVGAGRSELARLIFGADRPDAGRMTLAGSPFAPRSPAEAVRAGIGYVPEERRADGLLLAKSIAFNLSLANLGRVVFAPALPLVSPRRQRNLAEATIRALAIKAEGPGQPVGRLSGGNQQKVVIGRWLARRPKVLILDEPTRGVDVGARAEIHRLIRGLAADGMAVIAISSEPEELPDLCDRVLVMAEGRIVKELRGAEATRHAIVAASYAGQEEPRP